MSASIILIAVRKSACLLLDLTQMVESVMASLVLDTMQDNIQPILIAAAGQWG